MSVTLAERNAALDRAKALVLAGWTQGTYDKINDNGSRCWCAEGAVLFGIEEPNAIRFSALTVMEIVAKRFGSGSVVGYNDAPGRTKYEVAALFDHAKEQPL